MHTPQEAIYLAQQSPQEVRDRGQSWLKPIMTDSLGKTRKLADLFYPLQFAFAVHRHSVYMCEMKALAKYMYQLRCTDRQGSG